MKTSLNTLPESLSYRFSETRPGYDRCKNCFATTGKTAREEAITA
jgi:hypothetical protein